MATHSSVLPGESHGQRSLVGYSPWGPRELDMTEGLSMQTHNWSLCLLYSEGPALLSWLNSCYNIWERGGLVSYLFSSYVLVFSSLSICFMTHHHPL